MNLLDHVRPAPADRTALVDAWRAYVERVWGRPADPRRVDLVHGVDDDVIPFEHSEALAAAMPNAEVRVHLTGLYGHTGAQTPRLATAAKELVTMLRVLRVLAA